MKKYLIIQEYPNGSTYVVCSMNNSINVNRITKLLNLHGLNTWEMDKPNKPHYINVEVEE